MKKILVTGGCGFIGSHTIVDLLNNGFDVISIDSLLNSNEESIKGIEAITGKKIKNYCVDLCDMEATRKVFAENKDIIGIIHFAALKSVGESVEKPLWYYRNNINSLLNILSACSEFEVQNLIFSSSCSVYGNATELPVTETTALQKAESPYALTKQIGETMIQDYCKIHPEFNAILLRYFNPAGAHKSALLGEAPINPALSLVPVITETAIGKRGKATVFGNDYDTRDGSCIRDYIHVMDLANAHTKSMQYAMENKEEGICEVFNLGIGEGVTVLEAIEAFEKVTRQKLNYEIGPRRPGDVVAIYSNYKKAAEKLSWEPTRNIEDIMSTAWEWEKKRSAKPTIA